MFVFLNGKFVPEAQAVVSVFDRGFLYGDGLFETMRVVNAKPFRWMQHIARLERGAQFLGIAIPHPEQTLRAFADELIERNQMTDCLLRLAISRGRGHRGYSPREATKPTVVMSLHSVAKAESQHPSRWKLITSSVRLPVGDKLASLKTANKLPQILARAEADAVGADEALLLNTDGHVAEASGSNVFWIERGSVFTPPMAEGLLPGITRAVVFEICKREGIPACERIATREAVRRAEGVFLSLSSLGIVEVATLDGTEISSSPLTKMIVESYWELLRAEHA